MIFEEKRIFMVMLTYVDDIQIIENDTYVIRDTILKHNSKFALKDLGYLSYFWESRFSELVIACTSHNKNTFNSYLRRLKLVRPAL